MCVDSQAQKWFSNFDKQVVCYVIYLNTVGIIKLRQAKKNTAIIKFHVIQSVISKNYKVSK